jgi:hypothetical protein
MSLGGLMLGAVTGACVTGVSKQKLQFNDILETGFKFVPPKLAIFLGIVCGLLYLVIRLILIQLESRRQT